MDFSLSEEQEMLKTSVRDVINKECPFSMVKTMAADPVGYPPELWNKMAALGWLGLAFPASYGGGGGNLLDAMVMVEEMGRAALPGPFLDTVIFCGQYILNAGTEKQRRRILPAIAKGELIISSALSEAGNDGIDLAHLSTVFTTGPNGNSISGTKLFVPYAGSADYLLCFARSKQIDGNDGISALLVDARAKGVHISDLKTMSADHYYRVVFDNVSPEEIIGKSSNDGSNLQKALATVALLLSADSLGGAQKVLDMTVEYSKIRVQFGRPIGSMQAIQHHCSDMAVAIEAARALVYEAAWRLSQGLPFTAEASMAKSFIGDCFTRCTQLGMMIQGGISFMEDHELPTYYRRAKAQEVTYGDPDYHREMIAQQLMD